MLLKFRDKMLGGVQGAGRKTPRTARKKSRTAKADAGADKKSFEEYKAQKVSWLVYLIIGIIIIPFAFLGINFYFQDFSDDPVILKINDYKLTLTEFSRAVQQRKLLFEQQTPESMPRDADIQNAVLREIMRDQVMADELDKYRYTVPDVEVARFIVNSEQFQSDGVFDRGAYLNYLSATKQKRSAFEDQLRKKLLFPQIQGAIRDSSFVLGHEKSLYEELLTEERKIHYVELRHSDFYETVKASTRDVVTMYNENPERYMTKEKFRIEYIELKAADYMDRQSADADEIRSYYESNLSSFTKPERRTAAHILIDTKRRSRSEADERAQTALRRLNAGEDFERLVSEYSEDALTAERGGVLPPLSEFEIDNEDLADAVFSLSLGEVSRPIASEFGIQIFKLLDVQEGGTEPLEGLTKQIEYEIRREKANEEYLKILTELEASVYETEDFSPILTASGDLPPVKRSKLLARGSEEDVFVYPELREAVFSMPKDEFDLGRVVEVEPGHAFFVRVEEYQASDLPPLQQLEDQVAEDVLQAKAAEAANVLARSMEADLNRGYFPSIREMAEDYQRETKDSGFINRSHRDLPAALVSSVFEKSKAASSDPPPHGLVRLPRDKKIIVYEISDYRQGEIDENLKELLLQKPLQFYDREYEAFLLEAAGKAEVEFHRERIPHGS